MSFVENVMKEMPRMVASALSIFDFPALILITEKT